MTRVLSVTSLVSLAVLIGCSSLIGLDEFHEGSSAGGTGAVGGTGASGGSSGQGGSGNQGGAAGSSAGTSNGGTSGGGMGGTAGSCTADIDNDENNCGACGHVCSTNNASSTKCDQGVCTPTCNADFDDCNTPDASTADDGCEVNLKQDGENCSTCGRSCQGGDCSAGECQPLVLYEGVSGGQGIDVTDQEVFFTDDNDGRVYAIPKSGGNVRTVADGQAKAWHLQVDGSNVFWSLDRLSTGGVSSSPVAGGSVNPVVTGVDSPESITVGGGYVFYSPLGGNLHGVLSSGGTPQDFQFPGDAPRYHNGWLYFVSSAKSGSIQRTSTSGGVPIDFATNLGLTYARYLFFDQDVAIYSVSNPKSEVYRVTDGGSPSALSDGHLASTMTASNGWVFWNERGTPQLPDLPGTVWGVPASGGTPVAITDQGGFGISIVADGDAVYYATQLRQNTYSILKIARPQ
ncbi:MAG: hypothetical protein R3B07_08905 [Polyangiaceae bacterium]